MNKILMAVFATTMRGTIDQVDSNHVIAEMVAKDGHIHEVEIPKWIFPCNTEEGTVFWIDTYKRSVVIRCR